MLTQIVELAVKDIMSECITPESRASVYALVKLMALSGDTMASDMLPLISYSDIVKQEGGELLDHALIYANEELNNCKGYLTML